MRELSPCWIRDYVDLPVAGGFTSLSSVGYAGETGGQSQQGDRLDRGHDVLIALKSSVTKMLLSMVADLVEENME